MPARSARIYLFPSEEDQPGRVMKFPLWWNRRELFDKYRDREIDTGKPIYVDYVILLTQGEALVFDKECRETFSGDVSSRNRNLASEMQQLEAILKKSRWVIVESYEWESGLD